jgi:hypothetical protein
MSDRPSIPPGRCDVADATRPPREWNRSQRVQLAQALRGRMARAEIAARLEVAPATVSDYLRNPDGDQRQQRRRDSAPLCEACRSRPTSNGRTLCGACKLWTPSQVLAKWRTWTERYGAPPSSYDWNATHAHRRGGVALERFNSEAWPTAAVVRRLFGGWPGLRAAAQHDGGERES